MRRTRRSGFSLLELVVVIAIIAVLGSVGVWMLTRSKGSSELAGRARKLMADLRLARTTAISQELAPGRAVRSSLFPPPTLRYVSAGVEIQSTVEYTVFKDTNSARGSEVLMKRIDLSKTGLTITSPSPGTQIRFNSKGMRDASTPGQIILTDPRGLTRRIDITAAGLAQLQ